MSEFLVEVGNPVADKRFNFVLGGSQLFKNI